MMRLILCSLLGCLFLQSGHSETLPSLNYWDLSKEILLNGKLQDALSIDPDQLNAIQKVMKDNRKKLEEHFSQFRLERGQAEREVMLLEFDKTIKPELQEILDEVQLSELRRIHLRRRYAGSWLFFRDNELLTFAKVSNESRQVLLRESTLAGTKFNQSVEVNRIDAALRIMGRLSQDSRYAFAQYAGNLYLPGIGVDSIPNIKKAAIPFPDYEHSLGTVVSLASDVELQQRLGLSSEQVSRLVSVREKFYADTKRLRGSDFEERWRTTKIEAIANATKLLSDEQIVSYARWRALREFNDDFRKPFARTEFLNYLGYVQDDEIGEIRRFVENEKKSLDTKMDLLNRKHFNELCEKIPIAESRLIRKVFGGDW